MEILCLKIKNEDVGQNLPEFFALKSLDGEVILPRRPGVPSSAPMLIGGSVEDDLVAALESLQMSTHGIARPAWIALLQSVQQRAVLLVGQFHACGQEQALGDQLMQPGADMGEQFGQNLVVAGCGNRNMEAQIQIAEAIAAFFDGGLHIAHDLFERKEILFCGSLGAKRGQLILQFLGESVLMALLALVLALAMVQMLLPAFDSFLQRPLSVDLRSGWPVLLLILAIALAAGLISGSYPALVLSGFRPAAVLRTNSSGQGGSARLRAILVVLQFSVSIALGIAAAVVFSQISFARHMDLGFQRDNVLVVGHAGRVFIDGRQSFVQALRANPGVLDIALSDRTPFEGGQNNDVIRLPGKPDLLLFTKFVISPEFPRFYGMRLLAGRELSATRSLDQISSMNAGDPANAGHNILINETGAARLGFTPEQAVGRTILYDNYPVNIVGVLADANFAGAREPVRAGFYVYDPKDAAEVSVRLRPDMIPQTLKSIDKAWHTFAPIAVVNHTFLDDSFGKLYQEDERQGQMFGIFVGIAIFIACLGLFGLAAFTTGRRTKEIGLRKVFGGSTRDVVKLLLWQFSVPALIANLIAWPLAWYYLRGWLEGFAYRISLSPLYFLGAGTVALLIAWLTVLAHALRVGRATPIGALRYE